MLNILKKQSLFFCEPCVDIVLSNIPLQILEDLDLTKDKPCSFGDDTKFQRLYNSIDWENKTINYTLQNNEIINSIIDYSIIPAGSLANTFYTMNRFNQLKINSKIVFSYEFDLADETEKQFLDNINEENIEPIYLTQKTDVKSRIVKVCCMTVSNKNNQKDSEKRMISSTMTPLKLNNEVKSTIDQQLVLASDIVIEGFYYKNNSEIIDYIIEEAKALNIKVKLSLSAKFIVEKKKNKILRNILDGKISEIYGNEEEIQTLFQNIKSEEYFVILSNNNVLNCNGDIDLKEFSKKYNITILETKGEKGSILYEKGNEYKHKANQSEVINTMGAGDTFLAGFLETRQLFNDNNKALSFATMCTEEILKKPGGSLSCDDIKNNIFNKNNDIIRDYLRIVKNSQYISVQQSVPNTLLNNNILKHSSSEPIELNKQKFIDILQEQKTQQNNNHDFKNKTTHAII